jgi:hypothetical protein
VLCRNLNLFSQSIIAIDGSKFKAVNNRDRNFTQGKVKARMQQIEQSIDRYLAAMDSADRATPEVAEANAERLKEKIETLKKQLQKLKEIEAQLHDSPDQHYLHTETPDIRQQSRRQIRQAGFHLSYCVGRVSMPCGAVTNQAAFVDGRRDVIALLLLLGCEALET